MKNKSQGDSIKLSSWELFFGILRSLFYTICKNLLQNEIFYGKIRSCIGTLNCKRQEYFKKQFNNQYFKKKKVGVF